MFCILNIVFLLVLLPFAAASPNQPNTNPVGYEYLGGGSIIHLWNNWSVGSTRPIEVGNDYYINTSSGLALTNYYGEFWSRNKLCGTMNVSSVFNEYCTDALPFVWTASTDNNTYAATGQVNWADVGKSVGVGFAAGATFGLGTVAGGAVLGTSTAAQAATAVGAGVGSGMVSDATTNVLSGRDATENLLDPSRRGTDALISAGTFGILKGGSSLLGSVSKNTHALGAANPKVREAIEYGKQQHEEFSKLMTSQGFITNKVIPESGGLRPDAYNLVNRMVYELKPNSKGAINLGNRQLATYIEYLEKYYKGRFSGRLVTYEKPR